MKRLSVLVLLALIACFADAESPVGPDVDAPGWEVQTAVIEATDVGESPGFEWLPWSVKSGKSSKSTKSSKSSKSAKSMSTQSAKSTKSGKSGKSGSDLDATFLPFITVEACEWAGEACVGDPIRSFTSSGKGRERVSISGKGGGRHYTVEWRTQDDRLDALSTYRVRVLVGELEVGRADVTELGAGHSLTINFVITDALEGGAVLGSEGGVATLGGGTILLDFPPNALSDDTPITVQQIEADDTTLPIGPPPIGGIVFDFGPDGTVFAEPVTMTLSFDPASLPAGVAPESLRIFKLVDGEYVEMPGSVVDLVSHTVSAQVEGFSGYTVRPESGSVPVTVTVDGSGAAGVFVAFRTAADVFLGGAPTNGDGVVGPISLPYGDYRIEIVGFPATAVFVEGTSQTVTVDTPTEAVTFTGLTVASPVEWPIASGGNGNHYQFVPVPRSWTEAKAEAAALTFMGASGHLVAIHSKAENDFVYHQLGVPSNGWIGVADENRNGELTWVTGQPAHDLRVGGGTGTCVGYCNWEANEPNNNGGEEWYGEIWPETGGWNDLPLTSPGRIGGYIVEYETGIRPVTVHNVTPDASSARPGQAVLVRFSGGSSNSVVTVHSRARSGHSATGEWVGWFNSYGYVQLPLYFPSGPAYLEIRDANGLVPSNYVPIEISLLPSRPVVTDVRSMRAYIGHASTPLACHRMSRGDAPQVIGKDDFIEVTAIGLDGEAEVLFQGQGVFATVTPCVVTMTPGGIRYVVRVPQLADGSTQVFLSRLGTSGVAATLPSTSAVRWSTAFGGNGHYYKLVGDHVSWVTARGSAANSNLLGVGGHLATIADADENEFIRGLLGDERAWIGLRGECGYLGLGVYRWVDSDTPLGQLAYTNFFSNAFPEGCTTFHGAFMIPFIGKWAFAPWNSTFSYWRYGFVVEYETQ